MTSPLRSLPEMFDDLASEAAGRVVRADLAERAWRAGRRRRLRRRLTGAVLALIAAGALAVAVIPMAAGGWQPPVAGKSGAGVTGYPQRIGHQWWVRDVPARPGPVAGLLEINDGGEHAGADGWYAVSERGHRWRLPAAAGYYPTLSPDGRRVGYLASEDGPYVIHDLVTGERTEFTQIGGEFPRGDAPPYMVLYQHPSYWSPDGERLLVEGRPWGSDGVGNLLLHRDGSLRFLESTGSGFLAGWLSDDELLWFAETYDGAGVITEVSGQVTGLDGELIRGVSLRPSTPWTGSVSQWSGTVSPDRVHLSVVEEDGFDGVVRVFSVADGTEVSRPVTVFGLDTPCPMGWTDRSPTAPVLLDNGRVSTVVVEGDEPWQPVVVEAGLDVACLVWAADALSGDAHGGLFGMSTAWWTWWWREIAAALALAVAVLWIAVRIRRRRSLRSPGR